MQARGRVFSVKAGVYLFIMVKTDEFIANRLLWKAAKHDLPTQWFLLFKDLGPVDIRKVKMKTEWDKLKVDANGNAHILHSSPGTDFFALWNIMLMAIRLF